MINCLVFSKDRPAQLELLLRSIEENFKDLDNVHILYKHTSNDFKLGYDKVMSLHPNKMFQFIEESEFVSSVCTIVRKFNHPYVLVLVDDEVVIRDYSIISSLSFPFNADYHGISLRLHPKITHTYTTNTPTSTSFVNHESKPDLLCWEWRDKSFLCEFGYIGNINSCVYNTTYFKNCLSFLDYKNVNSLEEAMFHASANYGRYLSCFSTAKTISIANNKTQTEIPTNKCSSKEENTLENLNKKFLDGYRISTSNIYNYESNMATIELDYIWEKIENATTEF